MAWYLMMTLKIQGMPTQRELQALIGGGRMAGQGAVMGSEIFAMAVRFETRALAEEGLERFEASAFTVQHHELKEYDE